MGIRRDVAERIPSWRPAVALMVAAFLGCAGGDGSPAPSGSIRNVLIVTLDTVRQDHLLPYGGPVKVPTLERLAQEGALFRQAFTVAPITLPSHVSLFTGLYPISHGVHNNTTFRLTDDARTLAEVLAAEGFRTGAVVGAQVLDSRYGLDQGFEVYDDLLPPQEVTRAAFVERPAVDVVDAGIAWLRERDDERWFLWLHLFDPHWDYAPPEPFRSRYRDAPYDGEIAYADHELGRVLELLRTRGDLDQTLIVVMGDHGESLGDHGESTHGLFLYDAVMHVPLVIRCPGVEHREVVDLVRIIDIFPTVLDLLGIPSPGPVSGQSMVPLLEGAADPGRAILMETQLPRLDYGWSDLAAVRDASWKYIRAPRPELYDLEADPGELRNLAPAAPADAYRNMLDSLEEESREIGSGSTAARDTVDPATRRGLESLGYISLGTRPRPSSDLPDPKDRVEELESIREALELVGAGRYAEVVPLLQELTARNPDSGFLLGHLGNALRKTGETDEAIAVLRRAAELEPGVYGLWNDLGIAYRQAGDSTKARECFRKVLEVNPSIATAYHNLAQIDQQEGNRKAAIEGYEEALRLDPHLLRSLQNLGLLYQDAGRDEEAVSLFLRLAHLDPTNDRAFYSAAFLLEDAGRLQESLEVLDEAALAHPGSPLPHVYKSEVLSDLGDLAAAEREAREALRLDGGSEAARSALDRIHRQRRAAEEGANPPG
ncbi:MAG: sulfatase-like hydrolase/transferase [Acidobacteriota bacterium]|jgi:arylsulfatase A-like enzyme/Flp pilus assembly protein TadD